MSAELQIRLLDCIRGRRTEVFDSLALEMFAFQFERNAVYRAYCEQHRRTPVAVRNWREIPAVPTAAFKDFALTCFPVEDAVAEFHTSGTTRAKAGKHYFRTLELYDATIRQSFAAHLLPDAARLPMLVLTASPAEAPHSSLAHMMGAVAQQFGRPESDFYISHDDLLAEKLVHDLLEAQWAHQPVFVLGTAFAFGKFFEHCHRQDLKFEMSEGSRAMETGGFKGRSREMPKKDLYVQFESFLGISPSRVVNEYGMTELSTQFYDETFRVGHQSDLKTVPPWARVLVIDPNSGREAAVNERGLIRIYDPANMWSIMCVQTEDLGVLRDDGEFEVLGRAAGAEVRGCSLTAETLSSR
ncbi:MAG TPA: long-chain fatty acid--CoA ligase [Verrucomicrobiae bacterium]|nr:long-chain fatty acid--CoA ligase [Verrucomicrobiae bacterium]